MGAGMNATIGLTPKSRRIIGTGVLCTVITIGCVARVPQVPDPHRHLASPDAKEFEPSVLRAYRFERLANPPLAPEQAVASPDRRYLAYVAEAPAQGLNYQPEHFFLQEVATGHVWMLRNSLFPHRYVEQPTWIDDRYVCFDIWTTPHYGVHFVVDANDQRLIHAAHYHDEFIEQIESGKVVPLE